MTVIPIYAALLALVFVGLSALVIRQRGRAKVAIGWGGDALLERFARIHANFAEYVPLALLLLAMLEWKGLNPWVLHGLGLVLLLGRLAHAYGMSQVQENFRFRVTGMMSTFGVIVVAAILLLVRSLPI
jgi:hypothetical protein